MPSLNRAKAEHFAGTHVFFPGEVISVLESRREVVDALRQLKFAEAVNQPISLIDWARTKNSARQDGVRPSPII